MSMKFKVDMGRSSSIGQATIGKLAASSANHLHCSRCCKCASMRARLGFFVLNAQCNAACLATRPTCRACVVVFLDLQPGQYCLVSNTPLGSERMQRLHVFNGLEDGMFSATLNEANSCGVVRG